VSQCAQRAGEDCYQFPLTGVGAHVDVTSAHLWLYKTRDVIGRHFSQALVGARNQTITVRLVPRTADRGDSGGGGGGSYGSGGRILSSVTVRRRSGCWVRVDVHGAAVLAHLRGRRGGGVRVAVGCRGGCVLARGGGSDRGPVLVIGTTESRRSRRRRTPDAAGTAGCPRSQCCLHHLTINFAEIGWGFIRYPPGYDINYCHGPCNCESVLLHHGPLANKHQLRQMDPRDALPYARRAVHGRRRRVR